MPFIARLWNLFRSRRIADEIAEELQFHLESRVQQNIVSGMKPDEAEKDAQRRFGNQTLLLEKARDAHLVVTLQNAFQDACFAGRLIRRRPMFTLAVVALLGLGIGVSTSIFSLLMRAVFPRNAFENSARLVFLWRFDKKEDRYLERFSDPLAYANFTAVLHESHSLTEVSRYRFADFNVNVSGHPELVPGFEIEPNWLRALGVYPVIGRSLASGDSNVALVTQEFSKHLFGATNSLGRKIRIDDRPVTIVGVLAATMDFDGAKIFVPLPPATEASASSTTAHYALAELQHGFTFEQAQAEVNAICPGADRPPIHLATLQEKVAHDCGPTCGQQHKGIWLLFAAACLVTLLACANVGNLILARSIARQHEFAVRAAIGCSRLRLIGQVFIESAVLFFLGGGVAILVGCWVTKALEHFAAAYIQTQAITGIMPLDGRALIFTALATLTSAVLFGVIPAVRSATRFDEPDTRQTPKIDSIRLVRNRGRAALVASEFALSVMLLVGLGLLLRSFLIVQSIPVGINTHRLLTVTANIWKEYPHSAERIAFAHSVLEKLQNLPMVSSAALTSRLPLTGAGDTFIQIDGIVSPPTEVRFISVSSNFFAAMQLPIVAGRAFSGHDSAGSNNVVVINRTMAHALFPDGDAVGRRIQMDELPRVWREIVGIAADVRQRNLEEDPRPVFYRPYSQGFDDELTFAVRIVPGVAMSQAARALEDAVTKSDTRVPWEQVKSMQQIIYDSESLSLRRPVVRLLGAFGFLALLLTVAGLFAVLSYSVSARTREIGIRMAIGARQIQILRQIIAETLSFIFVGALIGSIGAYVLSQALPTGHIGWSGSGIFLYGVNRLDVLTYGTVLVSLCLISLSAGLLPARKAMSIDPAIALRDE